MRLRTPPWGNHPGAETWKVNECCKKCNTYFVEGCFSHYSGTTYYFCQNCGTDYPDMSEDDSKDEDELVDDLCETNDKRCDSCGNVLFYRHWRLDPDTKWLFCLECNKEK